MATTLVTYCEIAQADNGHDFELSTRAFLDRLKRRTTWLPSCQPVLEKPHWLQKPERPKHQVLWFYNQVFMALWFYVNLFGFASCDVELYKEGPPVGRSVNPFAAEVGLKLPSFVGTTAWTVHSCKEVANMTSLETRQSTVKDMTTTASTVGSGLCTDDGVAEPGLHGGPARLLGSYLH
ncbi:hypothetical protein GN958_ATG17352 [Phytophthora infestans]|uniref:Uncharacterized protein n=1 Tax=Phytophthora infestans TaxID=4787 RepID=A0A8S9TZF4_PHYIN|nr:hypothetical protein GN958_ATG18237 [Phytophthora infestans]KAF4133423.1 hypothetical protein GN958_ATG17352 [Phytophthora infestans]